MTIVANLLMSAGILALCFFVLCGMVAVAIVCRMFRSERDDYPYPASRDSD